MNKPTTVMPNGTCPDCQAPWTHIERKVQRQYGSKSTDPPELMVHVHGGHWESIRYSCGRVDAYVPNFSGIVQEHSCDYRKEARDAVASRAVALSQLNELAAKLVMDSAFRNEVRRQLETLSFYLDRSLPKESQARPTPQ